MSDLNEKVGRYLGDLRAGASEDSFFRLLELGTGALPIIIAAASEPRNRDIRANLVEVIWKYRSPEAAAFLGEALDDPVPAVWKEALDGLVALGGPAAMEQMKMALTRRGDRSVAFGAPDDWLREALGQIV